MEELLAKYKEIFFAKTEEEAEQIEADFLDGKGDEFAETFEREKRSFYYDNMIEINIAQQQ